VIDVAQHTLPVRGRGAIAAQRAIDLVVGVVACAVFALPAVVIAVLVKLTSRGPVVFHHGRVGRGGEVFDVYKFRSMREGTEVDVVHDPALWASYVDHGFKLAPDDPHITRFGRMLRRTSLDELPQLVNVLRGEMSLVGVRPLLAEELALRSPYDQALYRTLRPGMTGLWQTEGRSTVHDVDRLLLDRRYLEQWSPWGDLVILARTPRALVRAGHAQ